MKFLNLDLDFFQNEIVYSPGSVTRRANKKRYKPWTADKVREFLEIKCHLDRKARIPGVYVTHHDLAFDHWSGLLSAGGEKLQLVHVDVHGDFSGQIDRIHPVNAAGLTFPDFSAL
jgi:hypothetical protein